MNVLVILVPASLLIGLAGLAAFVWTVRSDQYSDMEGDAWRILDEEDGEEPRGPKE